MNRDLTSGNPQTVLWQFSLPLLGSVLFQQLYNIADSLVVGKFVGENALAAVGNSYEITLIFIALAFGCNIGCSVVVSRNFGAKKWNRLRSAVSTTFISVGVLCAALVALGLLLCRSLLLLIHTPEELLADCALYLNIYILGLPFLMFYNVGTGIFSAMGDSRTPFLFLAASSTSNIVIDVLFVKGFSMGVAGVAWATFLCQGCSCVLALVFLYRRLKGLPEDTSGEKAQRFSLASLRDVSVIAFPSMLQQSFISIGNIVIQSVINGYGASVIAGYAAAIKLNNLVITSFTQLGNGMSNYASQNIGAGKYERLRSGYRAGIRMVLCLCVPVILLYAVFTDAPLSLFLNSDAEQALDSARWFLRIVSPFYVVVSLKLIADGILRGAGLMRQFMAATFSDLILRVLLCIGLSALLGWIGIWCAWPIGWVIGTGISIVFCRNCLKRFENR